MFSKTVIQTSIVIIATSALLIGGLGVIAAKAAPLNHSQIQTSEITAKESQVQTPSFGNIAASIFVLDLMLASREMVFTLVIISRKDKFQVTCLHQKVAKLKT